MTLLIVSQSTAASKVRLFKTHNLSRESSGTNKNPNILRQCGYIRAGIFQFLLIEIVLYTFFITIDRILRCVFEDLSDSKTLSKQCFTRLWGTQMHYKLDRDNFKLKISGTNGWSFEWFEESQLWLWSKRSTREAVKSAQKPSQSTVISHVDC